MEERQALNLDAVGSNPASVAMPVYSVRRGRGL